MATFTPTVRVIVNGEAVDAAVTNGPIADLTQRTDWLYDQIQQLLAGSQLLLRDQAIASGLTDGTPVYYDDTTSTFKAAKAAVDNDNLNLAATTSFWQGFLANVNGTTADVVINGVFELAPATWASIFEDGVFTEGDLFLSAATAGKITPQSGTTGVYLGHMRSDGSFNVRPGGVSSFLQHVHYERELSGNPAGTVVDPAVGGTQTVTAPNPALVGWLPANATYFPGYVVGVQIPVGAKFGYNIQQASETALREIFPVVPADNAQFSQGGLIVSSDKVVTNNFGIWWMQETYGDAPWPVDYNATSISNPITLWTTRLVAEVDLVGTLVNAVINTLASGSINDVAVAKIFSGNQTDLEITGTDGSLATGFQGTVTITNKGVTSIRGGRGLAFTGSSGDITNGLRGLVDGEVDIELAASHLYTNLTVPGDALVPVTTNGVSFGTSINLYGHRLGATVATDYIDFVVTGGNDLEAATDYYVIPVIIGCVDSPSGVVTAKQVGISFYRYANGDPASTLGLESSTNFFINTGTPGTIQNVVIGPLAPVVIRQNQTMIVRLTNSVGGSPLTPDTLRVVSLRYRLQKV
jgi:hypothetical protein